MKKILRILVIFLLLLLPAVFAQQPNDLYRYDSLTMDITISGEVNIEHEETGSYIEYLNTELFLFPREEQGLTIEQIQTTPDATKESNAYLFSWQQPTIAEFQIEAEVTTNAQPIEISTSIPFPLELDNSELEIYLEETEMIDYSNIQIKNIANELADGETNTLAIAVKIADWTRNEITYNLTTLTAQATQSASWVLENKYGVCDELTNLYIALLRSIGIPARFVTGMSHTSSDLFADPWNPHGWAEVYLPEYGWVPFDVTYGQYGFVDPTHIKLSDAVDSEQASMSYQWQGTGISVEAEPLFFDVEITEYGTKQPDGISISANAYKEEVGFGSFNLILVEVENEDEWYKPVTVYLAAPQQLTILDEEEQTILLEPAQTKTIGWIVQVDENLEKDYIYTLGPKAYTITNTTSDAMFQASYQALVMEYDNVYEIKQQIIGEEEKEYEREIDFSCTIDNQEFYLDEKATISCEIKNTGNTKQTIDVCYEDTCQEELVEIAQSKEVHFDAKNQGAKEYLTIIKAENGESTVISEIEYTIYDVPEIEITTKHQETAGYDETIELTVEIEKESFQTPQNVLVLVAYGNTEIWIQTTDLAQPVSINEEINTRDFRKEKQDISITVQYEDKDNAIHETSDTTTITLTDLTMWQKIKIKLLGLLGL